MTAKTVDIVIIGGGIMGSAAAYYLIQADPQLKLAVIERDPTYARASTTLSAANVRVQFSLPENVKISQYAIAVLEQFEEAMAIEEEKPRIHFRQEGNLFLVDEAGNEAARKALAMQQHLGCQVSWWSPEEIKKRYSLYHTEGLTGGTFGPKDGHFDAHAVLMAYKAKARSLNAEFISDEVMAVSVDNNRATGVELAQQGRLSAPCIINCAGAWATDIAATVGITLPIAPVKRQVFVLDTAVKPDRPLPLTILPSGLYFRSETGGLILLGKSMAEDSTGFSFNWDDKRFMEILWPELAEFVPAFDRLKLIRGWAGLYAVNTLDGNAILGEWPELKGFYLANGFSGHGLQQAPAVGRYLSELILNQPVSLDLSLFGPERILANRPLSEAGLV